GPCVKHRAAVKILLYWPLRGCLKVGEPNGPCIGVAQRRSSRWGGRALPDRGWPGTSPAGILAHCCLSDWIGTMKRFGFRGAFLLAPLLICLLPVSQAAAGRFAPIRLPADAAMHPASPYEWWYFVGHLHDPSGRTFGFELVNFKFSHLHAVMPAS